MIRAITSAQRALPLASCAASCSPYAKSAREQAFKGFVMQKKADDEGKGGRRRAVDFEGCKHHVPAVFACGAS